MNDIALNSTIHGAGRVMGRRRAKQEFNREQIDHC
jgi:RNA-splicing ligase RtcB